MTLTVKEKEHWKERISRKIDQAIDTLCAQRRRNMTRDTTTAIQLASGRYSYYRDKDGCHDIFFIEDSQDGAIVMGVYFWDERDTNEAVEAEVKAQLIVQALNMPGGWIDQEHVTR